MGMESSKGQPSDRMLESLPYRRGSVKNLALMDVNWNLKTRDELIQTGNAIPVGVGNENGLYFEVFFIHAGKTERESVPVSKRRAFRELGSIVR